MLLLYWDADAGSQNYVLALAGEMVAAGYHTDIDDGCCDVDDLVRIYHGSDTYMRLDYEGNLHVLHF